MPWSTADVDSGIMVSCTSEEIIEAHKLSIEAMPTSWERQPKDVTNENSTNFII